MSFIVHGSAMADRCVPTFESVLSRYASAHNASGTDKTTSHSYGALYSALFEPLRLGARRVLEIGVYSGASVLAMADFFESADVLGLDITLSNVRFGLEHPRVRFVLGDGTSPETAADVSDPLRPFDLVLDDGSHRLQDQIAALKAFAPHLNAEGGLYVIEDIASGEFRQPLSAAARECTPRLELLAWHDLREHKGQFDDIVAVFRVARG